MSIVEQFKNRTPKSRRLFGRAVGAMPGGITHDLRRQHPYPLYVSHGEGSRKWDADGNEYIDYHGGHGALLLGHGRPEIVAAVRRQAARGTHLGGSHEQELRWAELVRDLIPSAEKVRFTASGTEAAMLALRLARAHSGRSKFIRFKGHFHGWYDQFVAGYASHFDGSAPVGVPADVASAALIADPGDEDAVLRFIDTNDGIAAIILEPTGAHFGAGPLDPSFLSFLREVASSADIVLIFDEVVTGFRVSPGGAQAHFGVTPDLTTLGKVLAGGLGGGAVAGRADILSHLDFEAAAKAGREKIGHPGTHNGNPLSAAAGIAALEIVAGTDACERANNSGEALRRMLNQVLTDEKVPWSVYGEFSGFNLFTNPGDRRVLPLEFDPATIDPSELTGNDPELVGLVRLAMLINGVDVTPRFSGWISAVHEDRDLQKTAEAFQRTIGMLKKESVIAA